MVERIKDMADGPASPDQSRPSGLIFARTIEEAAALARQPNVPIIGPAISSGEGAGGPPRPPAEPLPGPESPRGPEIPRGRSHFQQVLEEIRLWEEQPDSVHKSAVLEELRERVDYYVWEANRLGLAGQVKTELSGVLYGSRVKVTLSEKEGRDEFTGRGKIQELQERQQQAYDPNSSLERDRNITDSRGNVVGVRAGFWSNNPLVRQIEQQYAAQGQPVNLEQVFGGVVDYINQNSIDMILEVVRDRKRYTTSADSYPNKIINDIWDGPVRDTAGHILKDEDGNEVIAQNFDDVRAAIEEARRQEPWVPNRQDYETYIRFVADDVEELEEMIPYIVSRVIRKLGTGQPDKLSGKLEEEKGKIDGALASFPTESERQFRRLKSTLADSLNLMGAYYFSDKVQDDWGPYLSYMDLLAAGSQDTEQQDHLVDALLLDKDGLTLLAVNQFMQDDGIFWRYGQKAANLATGVRDINKLFRWQERRRKEIGNFLMGHKLKEVDVLLGLKEDRNGNISVHPAFQRLKDKFDALDQKDIDQTASNGQPGYILDADDEPTTEKRWDEYCKKALEWQKTGKFGDPREAERVIFQHPLARAFRPPVKDAQGQVSSEFLDMYEEDTQIRSDRWYRTLKSRKVKSLVGNAEREGKSGRIARAFMLDSAAALAWHVFRNDAEVAEVNKYLQGAGMETITKDEAVSQKTLYRALMQALVRKDQTKPPKDRNFKFFYLLTEKLGLDLDMPTFAAWYLGAHDTTRPSVILQAVREDNQDGGLSQVMPAQGMDEKNTGAMWAERERRLRILVQMVMKDKFGGSGRYFNFPGHDTRGAGVKDVRNYLNLMYGTSKDTVWLNDLLTAAIPLEQEFTGDFGLTRDPITQLVGLYKGGDEAVFAQSGYAGLIENPRDFRAWVKRSTTNVERNKALTSGGKDGYALMKSGPFSGMYLWRDFDLSGIEGKYNHPPEDRFFAVNEPAEALKEMKESTYRAGIDLAGKTTAHLVELMKHNIESTFGRNPGSAKFANTLLWYQVSKWMDSSWEYREKPGYSVDGNLSLARYFMHTVFLEEEGLIYSDKEWDEIMLGYITKQDGTRVVRYEVDTQGRAKDSEGNWIEGSVQEGLIDAFPDDLRNEILKGETREVKDKSGKVVYTYKDYCVPFGLNSRFPETMANYYRDGINVQTDYKGALHQKRPRKMVARP